jgi:hypothetical protein
MGNSGLTRFTMAQTQGEATTFPHIVYSAPLRGSGIQMAFCPGTPKWESQNRQGWESRNFAGL